MYIATCLARAGAFDRWGNRAAIAKLIEDQYDRFKDSKESNKNQLSLFSMGGGASGHDQIKIVLPEVESVSVFEQLSWEKELYGTFISSHPIEHIKPYLKAQLVSSIKTSIIKGKKDVRLAGYIRRLKKHKTKSDTLMAFVELEDHTASIDAVLFPKMYEEFAKEIIKIDLDSTLFIFTGVLQKRTNVVTHKTVIEDQPEDVEEQSDSVDTSEYSFVINHFEVVDYDTATSLNKSKHQLLKLYEQKKKWFEEYLQNLKVSNRNRNYDKSNNKSSNNYNGNMSGNYSNSSSVRNNGQNNSTGVKKVTFIIANGVPKDKLMELKTLLANHPGDTELFFKLRDGKLAKYKNGINYAELKNKIPWFVRAEEG